MKESAATLQGLTEGLQSMATQVLAYLPKVAAAVIVLVLGWLLARLVRLLVVRAIGSLDQLWQRLISKRGLEHLRPRHTPVHVVGELVFWLLLLLFINMAAEILGLNLFGSWLKEIFTYLPLVAAGLLIMLIGYVVSSLLRDVASSAAASAGLSHGEILGRAAQLFILIISFIIGIDQIGIDIGFLSIIAGITLATLLGGIALAFGLGARTHVSNIIAANQIRHMYQGGDKVRIGNIEGRVIAISVSRVTIETEEGSVDIPAKLFDEQVTTVIEKGA